MKSVWAIGIPFLGRGAQHWSAGADRQGGCRALGRGHSRCGHHDGHLHQILRCCRRLHCLQQVTARTCPGEMPFSQAIAPLAVRSHGEGVAPFSMRSSFWLVVGLHMSRDANSGRCRWMRLGHAMVPHFALCMGPALHRICVVAEQSLFRSVPLLNCGVVL